MASKVLILVEGRNKDVRLMQRLFEIYLENQKKEIVYYDTNVYELYGRLTKEYGEDEAFADLLMVLREKEKDIEKKKLFDEYYSDVILVFDFDPQDRMYSADKLIQMIKFFNNPIEGGRLYINYPMVESICHIKSWEESPEIYNNRYITKEVLLMGNYKKLVDRESCCLDIKKYEKENFDRLIMLNLSKIMYLLGKGDTRKYVCDVQTLEEILIRACERWDNEGIVDVLNTGILYMYEFYPKKVAV